MAVQQGRVSEAGDRSGDGSGTEDSASALLKPFPLIGDQVQALKAFAANPRQRIRTGLPSLDDLIDGPAAGEVCMFLGRSHSGKSMVAHNIMLANPAVPMVFFSIEMPDHQALRRMYSAWANVRDTDVQNQLRQGTLPARINELADVHFQHVIQDGAPTFAQMSRVLEDYGDWFGHRPEAVIVDYLELIATGEDFQGDSTSSTVGLARALKTWSKREHVAVFVMHQTNRSEKLWDPPTVDSARAGGYTESDVVVGMWQPGTNPDISFMEKQQLFGLIRMRVIKNRINGKLSYSDLELRLQPSLRLRDLTVESQGVIPY